MTKTANLTDYIHLTRYKGLWAYTAQNQCQWLSFRGCVFLRDQATKRGAAE